MGSCPHEVLAATLTLFQPGGGADCALHILMSPPSFENHKRTWVDSKLDYLEPSGFLPEGDAQLIEYTLESVIDVGQGISVGPGRFVKNNKRRVLNKRRAWKIWKKE
jgi:hypothetical protein